LSGVNPDEQARSSQDFDAGPDGGTDAAPTFSICVPHYNRTRHLLVALQSLAAQTYRDFELCISDDCSTDGRGEQLRRALRASRFAVRYRLQPRNLRYDGNLRSAIGLSRGRFCMLMGNDDCLNGPEALATIRRALETYRSPSAVITDFADWRSRLPARRVLETRALGGGPAAALAGFRNASFVSGVVLAGDQARALATERWDGSEMYQVYLLCRIVSAGGALLQISEPLVLKDIVVEGEHVDSYVDEPRLDPCPIVLRDKPLARLPALAGASIVEGARLRGASLRRCHFAVARQLYIYTFAYWLIEYRRIQSRAYALGVAVALSPSRACRDLELGAAGRAAIWTWFLAVVCAAMLMPLQLFSRFREALYRRAKSNRVAGR